MIGMFGVDVSARDTLVEDDAGLGLTKLDRPVSLQHHQKVVESAVLYVLLLGLIRMESMSKEKREQAGYSM